MTRSTAAEIRERDMADLYERWHNSIRDIKVGWTEEAARRSMKAFQAIMEYIHDGSQDAPAPAVALRIDPPRAPPGATP